MRLSANLRFSVVIAMALAVSTAAGRAAMVGFYPFDEDDPLRDASGNENTLTSTGDDPVYDPSGGFTGGAHYYGGAAHLVSPVNINPDVYPWLTVGAWVKTASLQEGLRKILGHDDGGYDRTLGLDTRMAEGGAAGGPFRYTAFVASGPGPENLPGPRSTNEWSFVAVVYDDFTTTTTVYVDIDATTVGDELVWDSLSGTLMGFGQPQTAIGNLRPDNISEGWIGYIDNVFFYDELLTPEQLTRMRDLGTPDLEAEADPNLSVVSTPDRSELPRSPSTHTFTIPIRNDGDSQALSITSAEVIGADAEYYTVTSFPESIPAGGEGTIEVELDSRGQAGVFHATLILTSNDSVQPRTPVDLTATVLAGDLTDPALELVTEAPVFGDVGNPPVTREVEIRNAGGSEALNISSVTFHGGDVEAFTVESFPESIAPGESGVIELRFDPAGGEGTFTTTLVITSDNAADRFTVLGLQAVVPVQNIRARLIGFYPFDDPENPLRDESGRGNDLLEPEDGSVPTHEPEGGVEGGGYLFFGTERLLAPININPAQLPELTMGAWVRTDNLESGLRKIMGHDDGGWDRTIGLDNRGDAPLRYTGFTGYSPGPVNLPGPEDTGHWTFIAATYNQAATTMRVYVDLDTGSTDDELVSDGVEDTTFGPGFGMVAIGNLRPDVNSENWVGSIDNVFFYNVALKPEQVAQIRAGGREFILSGGEVPGEAPEITAVSIDPNGISITWSSEAGATYEVQYTEALPGNWTTIATQASQGASTMYVDNDETRRGRSAGFYRIVLEP